MAAKVDVVKPEAAEKADAIRGAWVVVDDAGVVQMVEASKMRAAMAAIEIKGSIALWPYGSRRDQVPELAAKP